ncbi:MAG: hypothetical protein WBD28_01405 [Candidatus Zixiibacteriota bacterium]
MEGGETNASQEESCQKENHYKESGQKENGQEEKEIVVSRAWIEKRSWCMLHQLFF